MMLTLVSVGLFILATAFLVWYFIHNDQGVKPPIGALLSAAGFGVLAIGFALWGEYFLLPKNSATALMILVSTLGIGLIEECSKFIPIALFIRNKGYFRSHVDGVVYFGIAGLTFGFLENMTYIFIYSHRLGAEGNKTGLYRLVTLLFFHAAATGIVGYYYAKAKVQKQSLVKPITALITLAVIHGIYDFLFIYATFKVTSDPLLSNQSTVFIFLFSVVTGLVISALLNTFLFLYYRRAKQWDASIGLGKDPKLNPFGANLNEDYSQVDYQQQGQPAAQVVHVQTSKEPTKISF